MQYNEITVSDENNNPPKSSIKKSVKFNPIVSLYEYEDLSVYRNQSDEEAQENYIELLIKKSIDDRLINLFNINSKLMEEINMLKANINELKKKMIKMESTHVVQSLNINTLKTEHNKIKMNGNKLMNPF